MSAFQATVKNLLDPTVLMGALFYGAVFLVLAIVAARAVRFAMKEILISDSRHIVDPTVGLFLVQLARIAIFLGAITLYFYLVPALRALGTALLTGVSVVSVIIGLAAQGTLGNVIAGFSLLLYRPFRLGDRVRYTAQTGVDTGTIRSISLGYTIVESFDHRKVVIPNSSMVNQVIIDLTAEDGRVMALMTVELDANADIDKARQILSDLARNHPLVLELVAIPVIKLSGQSVTLYLRAWCANSDSAEQAELDLYEQAKKRFDTEKIAIH